ncbi:DUF3592 domain-containing protein, partial [Corallococcus exiguus]
PHPEGFMTFIFGFLIWAILPGACLFTMVRVLRQHRLTRELRARGLRAPGEVVNLRTDFLSNSVVMEYVFHLPDGSEHHEALRLSRRPLRSHPSVGDPLEVTYLPDDPRQHQRAGAEVGLLTLVATMVVLVLVMVVGGYIVYQMMMPHPTQGHARAPLEPVTSQGLRQTGEPPRNAVQEQQRQDVAREAPSP